MPRQAWLEQAARNSTVTSGIVAAAGAPGLDLYPVLRAWAGSLGHVEKTSFERNADKLVRQVKTAEPKFDGAIPVQHGAMVAEGYPLPKILAASVPGGYQ